MQGSLEVCISACGEGKIDQRCIYSDREVHHRRMKWCQEYGREFDSDLSFLEDQLYQDDLGRDIDGLDEDKGHSAKREVRDHRKTDPYVKGRMHQEKEEDVLTVITVEVSQDSHQRVPFLPLYLKELKCSIDAKYDQDVFHVRSITIF